MKKKKDDKKKKVVKEQKVVKETEIKKEEEKEDLKKDSYLKSSFKELKNVSWPSKKDLFKYFVITLVFIIFFSLYFALITYLQAVITKWVR